MFWCCMYRLPQNFVDADLSDGFVARLFCVLTHSHNRVAERSHGTRKHLLPQKFVPANPNVNLLLYKLMPTLDLQGKGLVSKTFVALKVLLANPNVRLLLGNRNFGVGKHLSPQKFVLAKPKDSVVTGKPAVLITYTIYSYRAKFWCWETFFTPKFCPG